MGIRDPSVCQVLVNQGFLVLSSCLQEHLQAHRLQLDLGLWLEKLRTRANPQMVGLRDVTISLVTPGGPHRDTVSLYK